MSTDEEQLIDDFRHLWRQFSHVSQAASHDKHGGVLRELAPVAVGVICLVAQQPDIILREIGEQLALPKTTLTSLIDRLENRGFLQRVVSPRDRRSYGLALLAPGWQAYQEAQTNEERFCRQILGAFSTKKERTQFLGLFGIVTQHLSAIHNRAQDIHKEREHLITEEISS